MAFNKVGLHVAANNAGQGLDAYWQALNGAAIPFTVYGANDAGLIAAAAKYQHATLVYRDVAASTVNPVDYAMPPDSAAALYWARTVAALPPQIVALKGRVWLELLNEPGREDAQANWVGALMAGMARRALAQGWRVMGAGWAPGNPEPAAWRSPGWRDYLALCAANPDRVAVSLHEYSLDNNIHAGENWLIGRFIHLFEACDEMRIARPNVYITEAGWTLNSAPGIEQMKNDIAWMSSLYARHPQIKSAHLWTLQGGRGNGDLPGKLNSIIPWLTQWTISQRWPDPAAPPPPPPPPPPPDNPPEIPVSNLLLNGSFERGWSDASDFPGQHPLGWEVAWNIGPDFDNPHSEYPYLLGEAVHKNKAMLPANERDVFIWDGQWTFKVFAGERAFWARLKQTVDLPAGKYRLSTPVWVDCYRGGAGGKDYSMEPTHAQIMVKAGGATVRDWTNLPSGGRRETATEWQHAGGPCALAVHLKTNWPGNNNFFLDGWGLTAVTVAPPPPPPPPPPPVTQPVKVLDISKWQGAISPAQMKAAGVDGVMIRASYGDVSPGHVGTFVDEKADAYAAQLKAAGMPFGFYHYFVPARPVAEQFTVFRSVVERHGYQMRLALDLEDANGLDSSTAEKARMFASMMANAFPAKGKHLIYTSPGYWRDSLKSPGWGAEYDLWLAAWNTAPKPAIPAPWTNWRLWQWTSDGNGPNHGVGSSRVDLNRFNGDRAAFGVWLDNGGDLYDALLAAASAVPLAYHPSHAIPDAALDDGFYPVTAEFDLAHGGASWRGLTAIDDVGARRVYYAEKDKWDSVRWIPAG